MKYELINPRNEKLTNLEQVFYNRGIDLAKLNRFKYPEEKEILDPLLLNNMHEGVQMLMRHIANEDIIFIQVDADCDGYTSAAILINYLNCLFPYYTQTKVLFRLQDDKTHGLILDKIPEGVKLVIAPDSSSNQFKEHQELVEKGIDVLVLDHHEASENSRYACVINNQTCDYPTKSLSGAGIVYKFCSYIDKLLNTTYAQNFLDLVTVGLIADVMLLKDFETRRIILDGMNNLRNPLLKAIVEKDEFHFPNKELTPFNIAWYIAP